MNQKLTNTLLCFLTFLCLGCGSDEPKQTSVGLIQQINASGIITDAQAEFLSKVDGWLELNGLTSITDAQAESLSKVNYRFVLGLTSITDQQAEILSKMGALYLNGLTSITDAQAESLSKVDALYLSGLTSITDEQAESLSKVDEFLILDGLTSITCLLYTSPSPRDRG